MSSLACEKIIIDGQMAETLGSLKERVRTVSSLAAGGFATDVQLEEAKLLDESFELECKRIIHRYERLIEKIANNP